MQKFKYILTVTIIIGIIGGGVIFGMLLKASAETEKKYQSTIAYMEKGDWDNAYKTVNDIPHYKKASILSVYIYPHTLYYSNYSDEKNAIGGYTKALNYIREHKSELSSKDDSKYLTQILELEKTLNFKISESKAQTENKIIIADLNQSVNLIKNKNYTAAQQKLASITYRELDNEKMQLLSYIDLLNAINAEDSKAIEASIEKLDPNYSGDLSNEIKTSVQAFVDLEKWNSMYKPDSNKNINSSASVEIGDQRSTVIQSLGKPVKQNVISNSYGVFEELVFNDNKLVYIENNIVTAIKG